MRIEEQNGQLTMEYTFSEEPTRNGGLSLSQGQGMEVLGHASVFCQLEQGASGVHARGQDEYQWSPWG